MDFYGLLRGKTPFKVISNDKESGNLSHAYLFINQDQGLAEEFLKFFAKLLLCENGACGACRTCRLIDKKIYADTDFYPKEGKGVVVSDIEDLVEKSYIRPIEGKKRLFLIDASHINEQSQNKLLKTLEEPPENVHILITAPSDYSLLPTVLSRTKKLEIPPFTADEIFSALKSDYSDSDKLKEAANFSGGMLGKAVLIMEEERYGEYLDLSFDILRFMENSGDVLEYSNKILKYKEHIGRFLEAFLSVLRDVFVYSEGQKGLVINKDRLFETAEAAGRYPVQAAINAIDAAIKAGDSLKYNSNVNMVTDTLLFAILEGKYKWRK